MSWEKNLYWSNPDRTLILMWLLYQIKYLIYIEVTKRCNHLLLSESRLRRLSFEKPNLAKSQGFLKCWNRKQTRWHQKGSTYEHTWIGVSEILIQKRRCRWWLSVHLLMDCSILDEKSPILSWEIRGVHDVGSYLYYNWSIYHDRPTELNKVKHSMKSLIGIMLLVHQCANGFIGVVILCQTLGKNKISHSCILPAVVTLFKTYLNYWAKGH